VYGCRRNPLGKDTIIILYSFFALLYQTFWHFCLNLPLVSVITDCEPGKQGEYCHLPCRYPSYGSGCQLFCYCDDVSCDPSNGCTG
jgi:hypothetical protein